MNPRPRTKLLLRDISHPLTNTEVISLSAYKSHTWQPNSLIAFMYLYFNFATSTHGCLVYSLMDWCIGGVDIWPWEFGHLPPWRHRRPGTQTTCWMIVKLMKGNKASLALIHTDKPERSLIESGKRWLVSSCLYLRLYIDIDIGRIDNLKGLLGGGEIWRGARKRCRRFGPDPVSSWRTSPPSLALSTPFACRFVRVNLT